MSVRGRLQLREVVLKVVRGLDSDACRLPRSVLTIGNFDGLHRGHQQLLAQGAVFAANRKAPLVALTFEPHPIAILRPEAAPPRLMHLDQKLDHLARHGVDVVVIAETTTNLLGLEADRFIERLVGRLHPTHIVEGATFGFGRGRSGNPDTLRELGDRLGFEARIIPPLQLTIDDDETVTVSSSVIRTLITDGRVHLAALAMGRPYAVTGSVVTGDGRGKGMGFPTANLNDIETLIPGDGVYAGTARVGDVKCLAGISIGTNPTFSGTARKVEAHLLDFHDRVNERTVHVEFGRRLRDQRAFGSTEALVAQIDEDIQAVREHGAHSEATPFRLRDQHSGDEAK